MNKTKRRADRMVHLCSLPHFQNCLPDCSFNRGPAPKTKNRSGSLLCSTVRCYPTYVHNLYIPVRLHVGQHCHNTPFVFVGPPKACLPGGIRYVCVGLEYRTYFLAYHGRNHTPRCFWLMPRTAVVIHRRSLAHLFVSEKVPR